MIPKPRVGDDVLYTSKIDNGPGNEVVSPAKILRTRDSTKKAVIDRWGPEPDEVGPSPVDGKTHETSARPDNVIADLPDDVTVDLIVFGLGRTYREYGVEFSPDEGRLHTWRFPSERGPWIDAGGPLR